LNCRRQRCSAPCNGRWGGGRCAGAAWMSQQACCASDTALRAASGKEACSLAGACATMSGLGGVPCEPWQSDAPFCVDVSVIPACLRHGLGASVCLHTETVPAAHAGAALLRHCSSRLVWQAVCATQAAAPERGQARAGPRSCGTLCRVQVRAGARLRSAAARLATQRCRGATRTWRALAAQPTAPCLPAPQAVGSLCRWSQWPRWPSRSRQQHEREPCPWSTRSSRCRSQPAHFKSSVFNPSTSTS